MNGIEQFLSNFNSPSTIKAYRSHLKKFFDTIKADPSKYFKSKRDYEKDILTFWNTIKDKPPMTRNSAISVVKNYLEENDVQLPKNMIKKLKKRAKGDKPLTLDQVPTPKELRRILQHGETKARALFLMASSSGMRISEILQLEPGDIELDKSPVQINIPGEYTKTGNSRITFISDEAKRSLEAWLRERDDWLKSAVDRLNDRTDKNQQFYWKNPNDTRVFPFTYPVASAMWNRVLRKAGMEKIYLKTNRRTMHIHCLRKFFRVYIAPKATSDVAELLMGHSDSLGNVYRNHYTTEKLGDLYKKAMTDIAIFETTSDERINDLDKALQEKDKQIQDLQQQLADINRRLDKGVGTYLFDELQKMKKQGK